MFPHTLKRPIGPAKTLTGKGAQIIRGFSPGDRILFVADFVSEAAYLQSKVLIFSECIRRKAAYLVKQLAPPRSHRPRYHCDAVEAGKRASIHVLRCDVFQRLP